ncbi:MAG: hypothetical protein AB7P13_05740 [Candidatus Nitrosocosmicus sp.]
MNILQKKYKCEKDGEKFSSYEKFIEHGRKIHHCVVLKCNRCGKQFIHEKDRLHHVRDRCKDKL